MNLNRRSMMLGSGGLAALAASPLAAQAARASGRIASVGLQLYTVRELFAADPGITSATTTPGSSTSSSGSP